jgi:Domain of unknown function (DUF4281)
VSGLPLELLFGVANGIALVGWLLLAISPVRRRPLIAAARGVGVVLSFGYLALFLTSSGGLGGLIGDYSIANIARLFSNPAAALIGWVHYLAFDLWVGAWEVEDAEKRRIPHALLLPCLFLTFMVGPIGLLAYLALRTARRTA